MKNNLRTHHLLRVCLVTMNRKHNIYVFMRFLCVWTCVSLNLCFLYFFDSFIFICFVFFSFVSFYFIQFHILFLLLLSLLFYYYVSDYLLMKKRRSRVWWVGMWGLSGRSCGKKNCSKIILYKKTYFQFKNLCTFILSIKHTCLEKSYYINFFVKVKFHKLYDFWNQMCVCLKFWYLL